MNSRESVGDIIQSCLFSHMAGDSQMRFAQIETLLLAYARVLPG